MILIQFLMCSVWKSQRENERNEGDETLYYSLIIQNASTIYKVNKIMGIFFSYELSFSGTLQYKLTLRFLLKLRQNVHLPATANFLLNLYYAIFPSCLAICTIAVLNLSCLKGLEAMVSLVGDWNCCERMQLQTWRTPLLEQESTVGVRKCLSDIDGEFSYRLVL